MPAESRFMIKLSFLYLIVGFVIGTMLIISKAYGVWGFAWQLLPVHIEIMLTGWIIQLTLGTAYWIFPRFLEGSPCGNALYVKIVAGLLNGGIMLICLHHIVEISEYDTVIGRLLEVMAVAVFIGLHWKRVVSFRKSP